MPENRKQTYCKPALDIDQQIDLLTSRGLAIPDREKARHYLRFIGYYRLSGYFLTFRRKGTGNDPDFFADGAGFRDALSVYIFDRELRLLVMDAVERIEVAVRACLSNTMSRHYGPHWFMDSAHFIRRFSHVDFLDRIKRETQHSSVTSSSGKARRETFIDHYYNKYCHPDLPPSWMVMEVLSLGTVSNVYAGLASRDMQKEICRPFGIYHLVMESWLHSLTYLRNLCAHHARLWNRRFSITPRVMEIYRQQMDPNHTFYAQAVVLCVLMYVIADGSKWQRRLADLLAKHSGMDSSKMGFPPDWRQDPFWRLS